MTNNDASRTAPLTRAERDALYGVARTDKIIMPSTVRRLPPRDRNHSVKHRAYR